MEVKLLWENRNENSRGHEGVDNPSHPSCRTLLWFRSILREVPLVKRLWRTNEKIRADYLVGVRIPENTWPVQSRKEMPLALHLRFISTCILDNAWFYFFFFFLFLYFLSIDLLITDICLAVVCQKFVCQVFIAANCQINGPQVDFRIDLRRTRLNSWIVYI